MLPQLPRGEGAPWDGGEYSSSTDLLDIEGVRRLLEANRLRIEDRPFNGTEELLR